MLGVLGDLVEDIVVWLEEPLRQGTDTEVAMFRTRGGSAANVAAFAARHHPTRFLGCVGDDAIGDSLADELRAHGVDVRIRRGGTTGTILVLIDERGERTMLPHRGASVLLRDVPPEWTADLRHLHVPAYSFAVDPMATTARELVRRVRRQGGSVSIDASSTGMLRQYGREAFLDLLRTLEPRFLLANRAEADFLGLEHQPDALPERSVVVIKDEDRPTTVLATGEEPLRVAVPPVPDVRDTTGAGDAFAAGFLTSVLHSQEQQDQLGRRDLAMACDVGHAEAARVLASPGAADRPS